MAMLNNQMVIWCTAAFSVGWHMLHCCWATSRFPDKSSELQLWPLTTAALNDMDTSSPTGEETVSSPKQRTGYPGKGRPQNRSQNVSDACEPQVNERLQTDYEYIQICLPLYLQCCFLQIYMQVSQRCPWGTSPDPIGFHGRCNGRWRSGCSHGHVDGGGG